MANGEFVGVVFRLMISYLHPGLPFHGMSFLVFYYALKLKRVAYPTSNSRQSFQWLPDPLSGPFLYVKVTVAQLAPFLWQRRQYASCARPSCGRDGNGSWLCPLAGNQVIGITKACHDFDIYVAFCELKLNYAGLILKWAEVF